MSGGHDDYHSEPIRGLPKRLPPGERILWQGSPQWWQLAKTVFHIRAAALYFLALMAWRAGVRAIDSGDAQAAMVPILSLLPIGAAGLALLALLAWLSSRTTVYTITDRRIVLRIGVALTTWINVPFTLVGTASLRPGAGTSGDISLGLSGADRMAYSNLWPHVRPWRLKAPEPMLRAIAEARQVAGVLGLALCAAQPGTLTVPALTAVNETDTASGERRHSAPLGMPASLSV